MEWWRKANFQNNDEKGISYHHSQKIDFPSKFVCVYSQTVAVCSCSYLVKSRTKSLIKNQTSSSCEQEVGVFVKISCLTQRKHLLQLHTTTLIEFQILQLFEFKFARLGQLHHMVQLPFSRPVFKTICQRKNRSHKLGQRKCVKT